jgi:hypothetical protein
LKPNNDCGIKKNVADEIDPIPAAGKIRIKVAFVLEIKEIGQKHDLNCAEDANQTKKFKATT